VVAGASARDFGLALPIWVPGGVGKKTREGSEGHGAATLVRQGRFYPAAGKGQPSRSRDGNGYPRPDTRWVFSLLGYICGLNILPMSLLLGKNRHSMGKRVLERSAYNHTR
jgi:hypothetical protein